MTEKQSTWAVWTNAGQTGTLFTHFQIAKGLSTEEAVALVALLQTQGWDANRSKER